MKKKPLGGIKSGMFARGLSLASMGMKIGATVAGQAMGDLLSGDAEKVARRQKSLLQQAELLTQELGKLKGSLMKAGQMLSIYGEHFLPPEVNSVLKRLQFETPPLEWKEVEKALNRSLGKERMALLDIDPEAHAAASLGQVHRARVLRSGREVVIKVQYPGVDKAIGSDIATLRSLFAMLELAPKMPELDQVFAEIKEMMEQELDYQQELKMLRYFRERFSGDSRFLFPEPLEEFSTKKVLTMEYLPGVKIDGEEVAALPLKRRNSIGEAALDLYFQELFRLERVQTDPHFGNYRVKIGDSTDQLILYDFGAVRTLEPIFMEHYKAMLRALLHGNMPAFESAAERLGVLKPNDPAELKAVFQELCTLIMEPFSQEKPYAWAETDLPRRCIDKALELKRWPLRQPPREIVFLDRKMAGMFTFEAALKAKFSPRELMKKYL